MEKKKYNTLNVLDQKDDKQQTLYLQRKQNNIKKITTSYLEFTKKI